MMTRKEKILWKRIDFVKTLDGDISFKKHLISVRERKHFDEWEDNVKKHLPELARRVFDLRGKYYVSGLEKLLGTVIRDVNNKEGLYRLHAEEEIMVEKIIRKINVHELFSRLKKAEQFIK
jgi:hypothetical protein